PLFALGLLGGAAAPSMGALIAGRAVQGLGGGGLSAVIYASVARCYPSESQPRMLALLSTAWVVPGLVGPGLGGFVAGHASWRLVFIGLTPVALLCAILTVPTLRRLRRTGETSGARSHGSGGVPGVGAPGRPRGGWRVSGAALPRRGCGAVPAPAAAALRVAGVAGALPGLRPLRPPGTLRARPVLPAAIAAMGVVSLSFFGAETLLPLFLT